MFQRRAIFGVYLCYAAVVVVIEATKILQLCEAAYVYCAYYAVIVDVENFKISEYPYALDTLYALPMIFANAGLKDSLRLPALPSVFVLVIGVWATVPAEIFYVVDFVIGEVAVMIGVPE